MPSDNSIPSLIKKGHRHLFGKLGSDSFIIEQFRFKSGNHLVRWNRIPAPNIIEIWINLKGRLTMRVESKGIVQPVNGNSIFLSLPGSHPCTLIPENNEMQDLTLVQVGKGFMKQMLPEASGNLHKIGKCLFEKNDSNDYVSSTHSMNSRMRDYITSLNYPPVTAAASSLWYSAKIQELIADVMFESNENEFFCSRQKRITNERIERVKRQLRKQLSNPPTLQEMSRIVGCSPFYLSRTFSKETGMTIPQYLREIRIDRAAELLRQGECNVTEAAFEVGYNSASHFSQAFCQKMGVCPAMYPQSGDTTRESHISNSE